MNIEIVEAYKIPGKKNHWSIHVYLIDLDLDLRGFVGILNKNRWFFRSPSTWNIDQDTKQKVFFPIFSFPDKEKNQDLMKSVREKSIEYITNKIKSEKSK